MKISKEVKVGFVSVFAIALLVWGINFLKGTNIFFKSTSVYAIYPKVPGLAVSSPVIINGVHSGVVDDIYFHSDKSSRVIVKLNISESGLRIPKNSIADLISTDFMGGKAIGLKLGNSEDVLKNGDTLQSHFEKSMMEDFSEQILPIKDKAAHMMDSLMLTASAFTRLAATFDSILDGKRQRDLQYAISNLNKVMLSYDTLAKDISNMMNHTLKPTIAKYGELADTLQTLELNETLFTAQLALTNMSAVMEKMNNGQGTMGKLMNNDSLYNNLNGASIQVEELLEDIKLHPKRYFRVLSRKEIPYKKEE